MIYRYEDKKKKTYKKIIEGASQWARGQGLSQTFKKFG
jgi:hypothetical protein